MRGVDDPVEPIMIQELLTIDGCAMILKEQILRCIVVNFAELRKLCGYTTPECGSVQANSLMTYTRGNNASNRRMGVATAYKHGQSTQCNLEWNELEKLSRIYADWIEDMPLLHGSSNKVECYSSLV